MATPLKEIFDSFLSKTEDYSFIRLNKSGDLEKLLINYLKGAIARFNNCSKELSINESSGVVESDLNIEEIEILASNMLLIYTTNKITSIRNMSMQLTKAEYYTYSQANHILSLIELKKELQSDVSHLQNLYSLKYNNGDMF